MPASHFTPMVKTVLICRRQLTMRVIRHDFTSGQILNGESPFSGPISHWHGSCCVFGTRFFTEVKEKQP